VQVIPNVNHGRNTVITVTDELATGCRKNDIEYKKESGSNFTGKFAGKFAGTNGI
jgi:hypothetical protein